MRIILTSNRFNAPHWLEFFDTVVSVESASYTNQSLNEQSVWICTAIENWTQVLRDMVAKQKIVAVMALSPTPEEAKMVFLAGAKAYLHSAAPTSLLNSVNTTITAGGYWLPKDMLLHLVGQFDAVLAEKGAPKDPLAGLTRRERDVCQEVAKGHANKLIARHLDITERTVKEHLSHSFAKLNVKDRMQLMLLINGQLK